MLSVLLPQAQLGYGFPDNRDIWPLLPYTPVLSGQLTQVHPAGLHLVIILDLGASEATQVSPRYQCYPNIFIPCCTTTLGDLDLDY